MDTTIDRYNAFIFDFDGTLVEPIKLDWQRIKSMLDATCLTFGLHISQHSTIPEKLSYAFQYSSETKDAVLKLMKSLEAPLISSLVARPNVCSLLKHALHKNAGNVFIVSNNTSELINPFLESQELKVPQQNIYSLDRMPLPKPSIYFYKAVHSVCPRTEDCVYFGDSYTDEIISKLLNIPYINEKES